MRRRKIFDRSSIAEEVAGGRRGWSILKKNKGVEFWRDGESVRTEKFVESRGGVKGTRVNFTPVDSLVAVYTIQRKAHMAL